MPRRVILPLPRSLIGRSSRETGGKVGGIGQDEDVWRRMDRVQVLGGPPDGGHRGCVNALSWSDDGGTLLSGSDDKRICIWAPDNSALSDSPSPHPMKLQDTVITGHRANIFSAKYLPNTSTPTIVSCAGDRDIRVFEVERLGRAGGLGARGGNELWGGDGDGVTVLRCHHDRTKRIATETSPFLFLTVSEDGTVRQHDLRRPHRCKSECPEPLFRAPRGVDLYSLSVSTVAPHTFAVAGRTDCAFICDRRMLERQTPSWGPYSKASGQVHCVRRLGLPEQDWKSVEPRSGSMYAGERHITCVKMSPERADEVICAFARHSTSLFSLYDSPAPTSMRHNSASPQLGSSKRRKSPLTQVSQEQEAPVATSLQAGAGGHDTMGIRIVAEEDGNDEDDGGEVSIEGEDEDEGMERELEATFQSYRERLGLTAHPAGRSADDWADVASRAIGSAAGDSGTSDSANVGGPAVRATPGGWEAAIKDVAISGAAPSHMHRTDASVDLDSVDEEDEVVDYDDTGIDLDDDDDNDMEEFDDPEDDGSEDDDNDEDMEDSSDSDSDIYEEESDEEGGDEDVYADPRSSDGEYAQVPLVLPRRSYKGARNMETVKDCNFLGLRADKVCSGSDDGSWFVWDKGTGRLEGLWDGDGDVVNVMEQHPTLPIVAVSGIDNTVKLFAPPSQPIPQSRSFSRMDKAEEIMRRNTAQRSEVSPSSIMGQADLVRFLQSRGIVVQGLGQGGLGEVGDDDEEGEEAGVQQCATQ